MTTRVAVVGATGKMGRLFTSVIAELDDFEVVAELSSRSALEEMDGADLVVDVTSPSVSPSVVAHAVAAGARVLVGTSGWSDDRIRALTPTVRDAGTGVFIVPNFSLGSVLATAFARLAAPFYDSVEIVEAHRESKVDSPSGTAVRTAELIAAARRDIGPVAAPYHDQRARGQQVAGVPVHSLRLAGVVAKQEVHFGGVGEVLTLSHDTINPDAYRAGIRRALAAVTTITGVVVGLDAALGLDFAPAASPGGADVPDGAPSGQAATVTSER